MPRAARKVTKKIIDAPAEIKQMTLADRPTIIRCGKHFVNPEDVSRIRHVQSRNLWVVDFKSAPTAEFAFWLNELECGELLKYFNVLGA